MSRRQSLRLTPRLANAIEELKTVIKEHYPDAQFEVERMPDEPKAIQLVTTVDIEDPFDVLDLVIDRVVDLQVEERIPIHVLPMRPRERVIADFKRAKAHAHSSPEKTTSNIP